ncbi:hypothetical protein Q8A73_006312 [Channa argus]|nr:hypothetical protein Q8A73_006312 [Channa argus]
MAFANQGRTIPRVGLRRTLRFQWRSSDRELRLIRLSLQDLASKEFFGRFSDVVSAARYVRDPQGFWTGCQQFQVLLHPDVPEAIRADASVRVTLVPGGGDLRVKLSQYADDTTLLLDSDECVARALELFEDFGRVSGARLNIGKCTVKGGGMGVMLLRVDYQRGHALLYVFPLPVAIRRPLARTIFNFLWGGRYEWVARGRMMSGLAEGGRDVPDLPLKLDTIFVASLLQDMASEVGHPASLGMKYFFLYAARGILNWSNVGPRSEQLPWHYAWVAKWLRAHPKALEDGIWKQQRVLYRVVRGKVNPSPMLGVPSSVTVGVQAVGQSNGLKDLNWAFLHRTLPVRDKIHRHGLGRSPLCPRPSCGAGETAYHVVERGFVGAHIRSGWGILWLLLSLYKRGLWLARQEFVRSEVEWSGVQRGWLRGSNGRYGKFHFRGAGMRMRMGTQCQVMCWEYNAYWPVNSSSGTAQDFEVPVEEQRQGSDAKGFVLHQNHQGPVESDGGGRFLYSVASAGNRTWHQRNFSVAFLMWFLLHDMCGTHKVSGPVVDSSRFCCIQMFPVLLHPDAEEAIRADASVKVTLVPEGGDLRVKLSQYADDTTLLLDSDECVVRALELFEDFGRVSGARHNIGKCTVKGGGRVVMLLRGRFQRVKSRLALWKARKLTLLRKVLVLKADMLSSVLHLASVFPLPVAIRRPLARTIFDFLWGGRYEWVARGSMMSGLAEGGRDVPDLPLKLDTIFVASLLQDMASEVGHPASLGMKYFFLYVARGILNWSNVAPRSEQLPWHYAWVAKWLRAHPEALEDGIWKQQRVLYRVVRGKVNLSPVLGVPSSVWVGVQAVGLSNGLKDLNWACLHRTLPVRDKIHRHGLGRSPLCPRPSCGAGETAYHVMWEFSFARQLWAKAKKVVGRAKPDLTLTWQVVERGFVGAHIRSGWGILWLLLSLYKRGLWLARQELVRNGVEWSTERVDKGVEWEVTERMKWDVDKLGYHAAKEKWKGGFGLL